MIPLGTLFNVTTVIIGSIIGLFFNKYINADLNKKVFIIMGLFTLVLGVSMAIETTNFILMLISIVIGTLIGEKCNLDKSINNLAELLKQKLNIQDAQFTDGLLTAFLLYCVGSMTIVGAIDEGLGKTPHILYIKSIMDGISSIILASAFGVGVLFSIFPMLIFQGGITIIAFFYKDLIPLELIAHINSIGGILIIAIGIKILGYKKINPTNMLPALVVMIIAYLIQANLV